MAELVFLMRFIKIFFRIAVIRPCRDFYKGTNAIVPIPLKMTKASILHTCHSSFVRLLRSMCHTHSCHSVKIHNLEPQILTKALKYTKRLIDSKRGFPGQWRPGPPGNRELSQWAHLVALIGNIAGFGWKEWNPGNLIHRWNVASSGFV